MPTLNILDFAAVGDGTTNDAPAIQRAIDACTAAGGGTVLVPAGRTYSCGTITLKDNVNLYLEPGAVLITSRNQADFHVPDGPLAMITARGARNVSITGTGEVNGRGRFYMTSEEPQSFRARGWRPNPIVLYDCLGVRIRDVNIIDSAHWTLTVDGCDDVVISGIRMINDLRIPNDDGIDVCNSQNVRISDCHVVAGDDCIVIKAMPSRRGGEPKPCQDITVTNCVLESRSFAICVGCEAKAAMRNMTFDNCIIRNSHRGVGVHLSHGADVENVLFSNMVIETRLFHEDWWGRAEPIYVVAIPWTHEDTIGAIRNVRFVNLFCRSENGAFVYGWTPQHVQNITFDNVRIELDKWSEFPGGRFDLRPYPGEHCTQNILVSHPTSGFYIKNATGVTLRHCEVVWGRTLPDYFHHAIETESVTALRMIDFQGAAAHPGKHPAQVHQ